MERLQALQSDESNLSGIAGKLAIGSSHQQALADMLDIKRRQLLRIEQGAVNTSLQVAVALAAVFGMTVSELLGFEY